MKEAVKWGMRKARLNDIAPEIIVTSMTPDVFQDPSENFYKNMCLLSIIKPR